MKTLFGQPPKSRGESKEKVFGREMICSFSSFPVTPCASQPSYPIFSHLKNTLSQWRLGRSLFHSHMHRRSPMSLYPTVLFNINSIGNGGSHPLSGDVMGPITESYATRSLLGYYLHLMQSNEHPYN